MIEVLLVLICTAEFHVLDLTQRICFKKELSSLSRGFLHCFSDRKSAGEKFLGNKISTTYLQLHVHTGKIIL